MTRNTSTIASWAVAVVGATVFALVAVRGYIFLPMEVLETSLPDAFNQIGADQSAAAVRNLAIAATLQTGFIAFGVWRVRAHPSVSRARFGLRGARWALSVAFAGWLLATLAVALLTIPLGRVAPALYATRAPEHSRFWELLSVAIVAGAALSALLLVVELILTHKTRPHDK